jgi:hypothetical protein
MYQRTKDDLKIELLLRFVEWCNTREHLLLPKNRYQLQALIRRFPLIKKSGWWPQPAHRLKGDEREQVLSVIHDFLGDGTAAA